MLLYLLNKEEKGYFLDLLAKLIRADGDPSQLDLQTVIRLRNEMGEEGMKYRKSNTNLEKTIEYFAGTSKSTRNLVLLNLIGASLSDEFYSVEEHFLIEKIQEAFQITNKKRAELTRMVYQDRDVREKTKRVIAE